MAVAPAARFSSWQAGSCEGRTDNELDDARAHAIQSRLEGNGEVSRRLERVARRLQTVVDPGDAAFDVFGRLAGEWKERRNGTGLRA